MKHTYLNILNLFFIGILLSSCYEQKDPLEDLIERTGNHYPVVANIRDLESQGFVHDPSAGGEINLELQYWSLDPISSINFYDIIGSDTTQLASYQYQAAFSERSQTDTLVVTYQVPVIAPGTDITLVLEVVNENTLSDYGTYGFEVK